MIFASGALFLAYDLAGNRTREQFDDGAQDTRTAYDERGRISRVRDRGFRVEYGYDPVAIAGVTAKNFVQGVITQRVRGLFEGGGRINYATIAADSFGNALGNAVVGEIRQPGTGRRNTQNAFTSTARFGGPPVGGDIAQLPDNVSNALALNIGSDSIESPDAGPASAPASPASSPSAATASPGYWAPAIPARSSASRT